MMHANVAPFVSDRAAAIVLTHDPVAPLVVSPFEIGLDIVEFIKIVADHCLYTSHDLYFFKPLDNVAYSNALPFLV